VGELAPQPARALVRKLGSELIAGAVSVAGPGHFRNSALAVAASGRVIGAYDKMHPVPFGEYVPFRRFLGFVTALRNVPQDMVPGSGPVLLPVPGGRVGTPISFETAFEGIVRGFAAEGAGAIVVPTNTSSFGTRSGAAEQELQLSRMRAAELGLWVVQAAPSGISAFIDPRGRVVNQTGLYRAAILRGEIHLGRSTTPFSRWGETPAMLLAAVLVAVGAWPSVRRAGTVRGT
jgi:apolipoprotein N-acyltransferase